MTSAIICHFSNTQLNFLILMMVAYFNIFQGHIKQFFKPHSILMEAYQIPNIHDPS